MDRALRYASVKVLGRHKPRCRVYNLGGTIGRREHDRIVSAIYNFANATCRKRFSVVDVVDSDREPDPIEGWLGLNPDGRLAAESPRPDGTR
ncbi:MAG: hypothetical protein AB1331_06060 [Bacillota bacterium]